MGATSTHGFEFLNTVTGRPVSRTVAAIFEKLARVSATVAVISAMMPPFKMFDDLNYSHSHVQIYAHEMTFLSWRCTAMPRSAERRSYRQNKGDDRRADGCGTALRP